MGRTARQILEAATTVAVVGASRDRSKAAGSVPLALQRRGFRIIPVNPHAHELFGEHVYRSLSEIEETVDLVDVFRPSAETAQVAREAVAIGAGAIWLQQGIASAEARKVAEEAGVDYVENLCIAVEAALDQVRK